MALFKGFLEKIALGGRLLFSHPSWDFMLVLGIFAILFFYGLVRNKRRLAALVIYTYVALTLFSVLPVERIVSWGKGLDPASIRMVMFVALVVLLAILLGSRGRGSNAGAWWQILILSIVETGFLGHILLAMAPTDRVKSFTPLVKNFLLNPSFRFGWIVGPIAVVIFLRWWDGRED